MDVTPRYEFFEKVRIDSAEPKNVSLHGQLGVVLGRTETEDRTTWYYAVHLCEQNEVCCFLERELQTTGQFADRREFYDGRIVRVQVDELGRGNIVTD